MKTIGWKAVRDGLVKLEIDGADIIGSDPYISRALRASCVKVLSGGGRSFGDTRTKYVKGRYVFAEVNPKARYVDGLSGIYFFKERELAERYLVYGAETTVVNSNGVRLSRPVCFGPLMERMRSRCKHLEF